MSLAQKKKYCMISQAEILKVDLTENKGRIVGTKKLVSMKEEKWIKENEKEGKSWEGKIRGEKGKK